MTLSPTFTNKLLRSVGTACAAVLYTTLTFGAAVAPTSAEARSTASYYTVELAAPATEASVLVRGTVFVCEGTNCTARKGSSRPEVMCDRLARKVGEITKFTSNDEDLPADKLAKCNG